MSKRQIHRDIEYGGAKSWICQVEAYSLAIPPESTEPDADLDVYVYDSNGDLVATSTAGGTNEQVDILLPADGTWTVPLATGGHVVVDSAPTSATLSPFPSWDAGSSGSDGDKSIACEDPHPEKTSADKTDCMQVVPSNDRAFSK